jgi:DNA-binding transcriptional ArsR family regulator
MIIYFGEPDFNHIQILEYGAIIFRIMNMEEISPDERMSRIFRAISTPARLQILAVIGRGEACVCHLEALLDMRQAYISQQLMEMRDADLVDTRREGRYIFYRLTEPRLLDLLIDIGKLFGISSEELENLLNTDPLPQCCCPNCLAQLNPSQISQEEISTQK